MVFGRLNSNLAVKIAEEALKNEAMRRSGRGGRGRGGGGSVAGSRGGTSRASGSRTSDSRESRSQTSAGRTGGRSVNGSSRASGKQSGEMRNSANRGVRSGSARIDDESITHHSVGSSAGSGPRTVTTATTSGKIPVEERATRLLEGMERALDALYIQEGELRKSIETHAYRASSRLHTGNTSGALLSIKKMKHVEAERERLIKAIDYLSTQESNLSVQLSEYKELMKMEKTEDLEASQRHDDEVTEATEELLELSAYSDYAQEVQQRLTVAIVEVTMTDEELLEDFNKKIEQSLNF